MFYLGYFLGCVTSIVFLCFSLWFLRSFIKDTPQSQTGSQGPLFFTRQTNQKKKPKSFTEEEEWLKEQKEFRERR